MSQNDLAVIAACETIFFSHAGPSRDYPLRQWILVTIANHGEAPVSGSVTITLGDEEVRTELDLACGVHEYRCYAPTLWPNRSPVVDAALQLVVSDGRLVNATTAVGHHRPWIAYLLSDTCTDCTWVYNNEEQVRIDDAAILEAELQLAESSAGAPPEERNHYNLVHAREVEYYLDTYPQHAERLFEHIRSGTIQFNPFFDMAMTCSMSLEELIRQFYPARAWALDHDLDLGYANHQETPTIAWIMATVLAESGIQHLVKSILPYECPWAARLEEPPLYRWEGPDGSQILMRRRNHDYFEGNFVLRDLRMTNTALHDRIIPEYEQIGQQYPVNALALIGSYSDLAPSLRDLPAKKMATIKAYNAQGWDYPRLVDATHKQYWDDVDHQIAERNIELPVYRGDYGASWDAWPASLAYDAAGWRRAQERGATADKISAIIATRDRVWYEARQTRLREGWMQLTYLADHAWNGANDANRALNAALRRRWQTDANAAFDTVIADGLEALAQHVPGAMEQRILVFNGLPWQRTAITHISGLAADARIIDLVTGEQVPSQRVIENDQDLLAFEARDVPSIGYRVFAVEHAVEQDLAAGVWKSDAHSLEGPFYRVEISPINGGVVSLYDKVRQRELVDPTSPYDLNQCLYLSDGIEYTPRSAQIEVGPCGSTFGQLLIHTSLKHIDLTTTITLYTGLDRVDFRNTLHKTPTVEKQELDFAFPFQVPDRQYRFEAPGAIIEPGADQLPGAGQAVTAVRHFVDVFNDDFGVTLSQADSFLVEWGHRTTTEDPLMPDPSNSTLLALALENSIDWHEATRDQAGATDFIFRYSLQGHAGGFDPVAALHFGWEDNNELLALALPANTSGDLPEDLHSFVTVEDPNLVLTCLKVAEEDGLILRLWDCAGHENDGEVHLAGLGTLRSAMSTDLLERDRNALELQEQNLVVPVRAHGLSAVRVLTD